MKAIHCTRKEHTCVDCGYVITIGSSALVIHTVQESSGGWAVRKYYHNKCGQKSLQRMIEELKVL